MYKYILEDSQIYQNHQQKYSKIAWNIRAISICMHLAGKKKLVAYPNSLSRIAYFPCSCYHPYHVQERQMNKSCQQPNIHIEHYMKKLYIRYFTIVHEEKEKKIRIIMFDTSKHKLLPP